MADMGSIGVGHATVNRHILATSDFPAVGSKVRGTANRYLLATSDFPKVSAKQHQSLPYSKHIQAWSTRPYLTAIPASFTGVTAGGGPAPAQVYLIDNPGSISGTLKTDTTADYCYMVRLYYRPTGYMIDQVRTDINGSFVFNKDVDKSEISNYFVVAFDLTNNLNAVIYDLITAG